MKEWFLFYFGASLTLLLVLGVALIRTSLRASRLEHRLLQVLAGDDRTDGLDHVVDSLAAQVDRLAKGQEFLSDRLGRAQIERPKSPV